MALTINEVRLRSNVRYRINSGHSDEVIIRDLGITREFLYFIKNGCKTKVTLSPKTDPLTKFTLTGFGIA